MSSFFGSVSETKCFGSNQIRLATESPLFFDLKKQDNQVNTIETFYSLPTKTFKTKIQTCFEKEKVPNKQKLIFSP